MSILFDGVIALVCDLLSSVFFCSGVDDHDLLTNLNVWNLYLFKILLCIIVAHHFTLAWPTVNFSTISCIVIYFFQFFLSLFQSLFDLSLGFQGHFFDCFLQNFTLLTKPFANCRSTLAIYSINVLLKRVVASGWLLETFVFEITCGPKYVNILLSLTLFPLLRIEHISL